MLTDDALPPYMSDKHARFTPTHQKQVRYHIFSITIYLTYLITSTSTSAQQAKYPNLPQPTTNYYVEK
jgi:hypothetical protein